MRAQPVASVVGWTGGGRGGDVGGVFELDGELGALVGYEAAEGVGGGRGLDFAGGGCEVGDGGAEGGGEGEVDDVGSKDEGVAGAAFAVTGGEEASDEGFAGKASIKRLLIFDYAIFPR